MPRNSIGRLSQQVLDRAGEARRIQLRVDFRMDRFSRCPGELLGSVGGEWDLDERRFVGPGTRARVWYVSELQRDATVYWLAWLLAYLTGDWATFHGAHGRRPYTLWTVGGRRRGKTWSGLRFLAAFAIACPEALPLWLVSPIETDFQVGKELWREWVKAMPPSWYTWEPAAKDMYVQLVNGQRILMLPATQAEKLKQGGLGYGFWNEVQKSRAALRGLNNIRGGAADSGTLVHLAANPPREAEEYWIEDILQGLEAGKVEGKFFDFRGDNPYVDEAALDSMKSEMTERDYAIERGGERRPRPNVVMHAFVNGDHGNVRPPPATGEITEAFTARRLGRPFAAVVGCDFQRRPHQAATVDRYWEDVEDANDALSWTTDEVVVENGDEDQLIDGLEARELSGRDGFRCAACRVFFDAAPERCACGERLIPGSSLLEVLACAIVGDASGDYQRSDRNLGKVTGQYSFDVFRERGWRHLFKPDPAQERNPHVSERVGVANVRLCNAAGRRRAFVSPGCVRTREALEKWPNTKQGQPSRWSNFAHVGDSFTYKIFRMWPKVYAPVADTDGIQVVDVFGRSDKAW